MDNAGCECVVRAEEIAVMGITEVLLHMPRIYGKYRRLVRSIRVRKPDVAVLIDFPDVNFRLARELKKLGIPVIYFVSPQLWAWKKRRIRWVQQRVTKMLVIFPFEEKYYRERGVEAEFVGHPLADEAGYGLREPAATREEFARDYGLDPSKEWIGLLPGSRAKELRLNLSPMIAAANELGPAYEYVLPAATTLDPEWVRKMVAQSTAALRQTSVPIHVVRDARAVLRHSRASIVASGTATVEAALIGNPFIAVYRLSDLSYAVARRLVKVPHVAMANLIAGRRVVPELIQNEFTTENIIRALKPLLADGAPRTKMIEELAAIRSALHVQASGTAIDRVATWVLQFLEDSSKHSMASEIHA